MKDIIDNRNRIGLRSKLRLAGIALRENGPIWLALMGLYYASSSLAQASFDRAARLRISKNLPGVNSKSANKFIWDNWDWKAQGEEWTPSFEWKESLVRTFLTPRFANRSVILEIGPGAGRWTEYLLQNCDSLIGLDISEASVRECSRRFRDFKQAKFEVGNGDNLSSIASASIDGVWSFDVFVHINKEQFAQYVSEIARVLKPGGIGLIHHGSSGGIHGGWRSDVKTVDVRHFVEGNGMLVEQQIQGWEDSGQQYDAGLYQDVITCFLKPR